MTLSDSFFLERSCSGDPASFEALFLAHYDQVYAVLVRLLGNREDAEDLAQETFLRLHRSPLPAGQEHHLGGWLYRVATRLGYNALRARRRRWQHEQALAQATLAEDAGDPSDLAALAEERRRVRLALADLPARQAQLLILRHSGLSYKELAEALDVAPGSIGTLLARAERAFAARYRALVPPSPSVGRGARGEGLGGREEDA